MITVKFMWNDLSENMKERLIKVFGEEIRTHHNNWDIIPMAIMEVEDDREIELDSWTGDVGIE